MITTAQTQISKMRTSLNEIVPAVRTLPAHDKLTLIRILAEDLETAKEFMPFEPGKTYSLPTPYNAYGAAEILSDALVSDSEGSP
jgi:hypothetical protein